MSNPTYQAAKRAAGPDVIATVFTNLKPLMQLPKVAQLLEQQRNNPLAALSFAGIVEAVRDSNWLALGLQVTNNLKFQISNFKFILRASVDGKTEIMKEEKPV